MELSILLIDQIVIQFIMMIVGFLLVKIKLIDDYGTTALSKLVLYVIMPCSILKSFQIQISNELVKSLGVALVAAALINILFLVTAYLLKKPLKLDDVEQASLTYSNCSNLILPLVEATLGEEWLIYCCPYILVQNIIFFTIGTAAIRGEKKLQLRKVLNINSIIIFLGIFLLVTQIQLPEMVSSVVDSFANMIAPASMMVIGMSIGNANFKKAFLNPRNYCLCFIRLILMPTIFICLVKVSGICHLLDGLKPVMLIVLMAAASSSAAMVTQTVRCYGKNSEKASILNMMTVLFLIITMPLMVMIFEKVV